MMLSPFYRGKNYRCQGWGIALGHRAAVINCRVLPIIYLLFSQLLLAHSALLSSPWVSSSPDLLLWIMFSWYQEGKEGWHLALTKVLQQPESARPCFSVWSHSLWPDLCSLLLGPFRLSIFHRLCLKFWWEVSGLPECAGWHPFLLKSSVATFKTKRLKH